MTTKKPEDNKPIAKNDHFLKPANHKKVEDFFSSIEFTGDHMGGNPFVRFWNESTVQLDGDFTLNELKAMAKLMEEFE